MAFINKMLSFFDVNLFNIIHKYKTMTNMILNLIMMCWLAKLIKWIIHNIISYKTISSRDTFK